MFLIILALFLNFIYGKSDENIIVNVIGYTILGLLFLVLYSAFYYIMKYKTGGLSNSK